MNTNSHIQFHRASANAARLTARGLFKAAGYDRNAMQYQQGIEADNHADCHDLAASGKLTFANCADCR